MEKYLVKDRQEQLEGIRKGFMGLENLTAHFHLFSPTELALLMCGNAHINAETIKRNLKYVLSSHFCFPLKILKLGRRSLISPFRFTGFSPTSTTPQCLHTVLDALSQDNLRRFLRYVTGTRNPCRL
jgi:hypothetical protein